MAVQTRTCPFTLVWYDEGHDPPRLAALEPGRRMMSPIYVGDRGTMMDYLLIPEARRKAYMSQYHE